MILKNKTSQNQKGFSLIEVMVALAIFTFGILAVLSMQITSVRGNHTSYGLTDGGNTAALVMEEFAGSDYGDSVFTAGDHGPRIMGSNSQYRVNWTVTNNTSGATANTKTIDLSISWNAPGGERTVSFDFIKARDE